MEQQREKAHLHSPRILIVEDDQSTRKIWDQVLREHCPHAVVRWVATEEAAEKFIRDRIKMADEFDLVIVAVGLAGEKTGVDLWKRYGGGNTLFLFETSLPRKEFFKSFEGISGPRPFMVTKPLQAQECASTLHALFECREVLLNQQQQI